MNAETRPKRDNYAFAGLGERVPFFNRSEQGT